MRIPVMKLGKILLTAIQSDFTDSAAATLKNDILTLINDRAADGLVIDISALDVIDSYIVRLLTETVYTARLLGCQVVLSGMQPMVALTLMEMGRDLVGVRTAVNLELAVKTIQDLLRASGPTETRHGE